MTTTTEALRDALRWVPVSERLPEEEAHVLTFVPGYYSGPVSALFSSQLHKEYGGWWTSGVTHWMPLPPPPVG